MRGGSVTAHFVLLLSNFCAQCSDKELLVAGISDLQARLELFLCTIHRAQQDTELGYSLGKLLLAIYVEKADLLHVDFCSDDAILQGFI